ncbi:MAG: hypothetical protein IKP36_05870 [Bacteroidaceae bacterium]|nr:hypothetical protein [Bacteroidaceae bacterium]
MKKIYVAPTSLTVELCIRNAAMLSGSNGSGDRILRNGGEGDGSDMEVKGITDKSLWDNEW